MFDIGTICLKTAGRDAGQIAVIIDVLDAKTVLVDGQARRRKCNIAHLESTSKRIEIKKGASHADIVSGLKALGIEVVERKTKQKTAKPAATAPKTPVQKSKAPAKK